MSDIPQKLQLAYQLAQEDLLAVNDMIKQQLQSEIPLIKKLSEHIIYSGGKRIRPLLSLLTAKACNYQGKFHINMAVTVEFFHTASLLHDDVVDDSDLRRGKQTAHTIWDNKATILVGDFLFSRALQIMNQTDDIRVCHLVANTANIITQGEVVQLENRHNPNITLETYLDIISKKTGALFATTTQLSAVISNRSAAEIKAVYDFGMHLGRAFQIIDDALDYQGQVDTIGKNIGDDFADGKLTLPLILCLQQANDTDRRMIEESFQQKTVDHFPEILTILQKTDAIQQCHRYAKLEIDHAISALHGIPSSQSRDALANIAEFVVERES